MADDPRLYMYQASDRPEVFDFIREAYSAQNSARLITQWAWRYEGSPFTLPEGPDVSFVRLGQKMVGLSGSYRLRMWMGGIECTAEARGAWVVHPDFRGRDLWKRAGRVPHPFAPVQFGWSRLPPRVGASFDRSTDRVRPLVRVLDAGPLVENFAHSPLLASIAGAASTALRIASSPLRRTRGTVVRLGAFDERVDPLWERARRPTNAMIVRNHQYLNWRYCRRPDATYNLYAVERGSELDGFLVARPTTYRGMQWGYLVDFLVPENRRDIMSSLIDAALEDFRRAGVTAVICYATDPAARSALFRAGFFPAPQRTPIGFMRRMSPKRADLAKFTAIKLWYLTAGDGDLEMAP